MNRLAGKTETLTFVYAMLKLCHNFRVLNFQDQNDTNRRDIVKMFFKRRLADV